MKKEEEILSRITGYSIQELYERLTEPILQPYDCLMAMIEFAEQQANGVNTSHEPALHKHGVVGRSEQLVCPNCKGKNIEIRHREQSFRCIDCKEGWAN